METTALFSYSYSKPPLTQTLTFPHYRPANPSTISLSRTKLHSRTRPLTIQCTLTRDQKEEIVGKVKTLLEGCCFMAVIDYTGFTVKNFQDLRKSLPEKSKLFVAKNRLVYKAIEPTSFAPLRPCMKGMNAYLFVYSEEIPEAIKPYRKFQEESKVENDFLGAVFEGKFYAPEDFKQLETMPTREELYAKVLGALQSPAIGLVTTLQAPARDVLMVLKAYVKKLEDESGGGGQ
ncbi:60S ribosomal protein L10 [Turnera subulata]|uniref:Large ribosomal subunit protein uL10c n=1 Tax=Turnera subulata TaxID=218843 RepID=A0A9Q0FID4_9ROSI|nr:60S ribosomal protein L10 [Turnera subulata]